MLFDGCLTYLMVYQVLKAGLGGFFIYIGIVSLIFFSFPVIIMLGYVVCHLMLIVDHNTCSIKVQYLTIYSTSLVLYIVRFVLL